MATRGRKRKVAEATILPDAFKEFGNPNKDAEDGPFGSFGLSPEAFGIHVEDTSDEDEGKVEIDLTVEAEEEEKEEEEVPALKNKWGVETELCRCDNYEGDDLFCKMHEPLVECPKCHTIRTEIPLFGALPPMKQYRCRICGIAYKRNMVDGTYVWNS